MTKVEFDVLLNKASSGDTGSMRAIASLSYKMAEASMDNGDMRGATVFMEIGNGWQKLSEQGEGYGNVSEKVKGFTREAFSVCF